MKQTFFNIRTINATTEAEAIEKISSQEFNEEHELCDAVLTKEELLSKLQNETLAEILPPSDEFLKNNALPTTQPVNVSEMETVTDGNCTAICDSKAEIKEGDTAYSVDIGFYLVGKDDVEHANENHWKVISERTPETNTVTPIEFHIEGYDTKKDFDNSEPNTLCYRMGEDEAIKAANEYLKTGGLYAVRYLCR